MMRSYRLAIAAALMLIWGGNAFGHEVRPGYLELRQVNPKLYRVFWKVPAIGEMRLSIYPKLPANCSSTSESLRVETAGFHSERGSFRCEGGIEGREIAIDGLAATITDVIVRLVRSDDLVQVVRLTPSSPSFLREALPGQWEVAITYLKLGIEHILLGVDHLLFVLATLSTGQRLEATCWHHNSLHCRTQRSAAGGHSRLRACAGSAHRGVDRGSTLFL